MSIYAQLQHQAYEQELLKQAAVYEAEQTEALFDAAFNEHTAKLAALDPEYAQILQAEQEKLAFDQAYYETLAAYGQV
jgi:hypothetical protein